MKRKVRQFQYSVLHFTEKIKSSKTEISKVFNSFYSFQKWGTEYGCEFLTHFSWHQPEKLVFRSPKIQKETLIRHKTHRD